MFTIIGLPSSGFAKKQKPRSWDRGLWLNSLESSRLPMTRSSRKPCRSRYPGKPVVAKLPGKRDKSCHEENPAYAFKTGPATLNPPPYCIELAVLENTLLALDPIRRIVPTTKTRITASITAYSAMSCPASSTHNLLIISDMLALQLETSIAAG
jgi:hypothetical protein